MLWKNVIASSTFFLLLSVTGLAHAQKVETETAYFPAWLQQAPHTPHFVVLDTSNKYGRYSKTSKIISLGDLIRFHGHFCGGLVELPFHSRWLSTIFILMASLTGLTLQSHQITLPAAEMSPLTSPEQERVLLHM